MSWYILNEWNKAKGLRITVSLEAGIQINATHPPPPPKKNVQVIIYQGDGVVQKYESFHILSFKIITVVTNFILYFHQVRPAFTEAQVAGRFLALLDFLFNNLKLNSSVTPANSLLVCFAPARIYKNFCT